VETARETAVLICCVGLVLVAAIFVKTLARKVRLPALAGYILMGIGLRYLDSAYGMPGDEGEAIIHFLAEMGVIILLFHIGLESKLQQLLAYLGRATLIGAAGLIVSALVGFAAAYYVLELSLLVSLVIGVALVATSVGVSAGVWEENGVIGSKQGQFLVDVAEFDNITGVIIMSLLFTVAPQIAGDGAGPWRSIFSTLAGFAAKLFVFGLGCLLFARYVEKPVTDYFKKLETGPDETLTVIGFGLLIAAAAALLGFSAAIGAFFAGLIFSRDPGCIKTTTAVTVVYDLFVPFFFVAIGFKMQTEAMGAALWPAAVLVAAAFVGKFVGTLAGALPFCGAGDSMVLAVSMIPRAEVAMIIMQQSLNLETQATPGHIYSAMVIMCIITCLVPPIMLNRLIPKYVRSVER